MKFGERSFISHSHGSDRESGPWQVFNSQDQEIMVSEMERIIKIDR